MGFLKVPVRNAVFRAIGEIDFGGSEIRVPASRFEGVRAAIARQFEDLEIISTNGAHKITSKIQAPCNTAAQDPVATVSDPDDHTDYVQHFTDGSWGKLIDAARCAREIAREINTPKKGARRVKWPILVRSYSYQYRHQSLTLMDENDKPRTKKRILAWIREVNLNFRSGVL